MKILITGSNGQLGNELKSILETGEAEIGRLDVSDFSADFTDLDDFDIADLNAVSEVVSAGGYDAIINCAAYTNVNGCESNRDIALRANSVGARNLAIAAEKNGAKIIQISTDYVFAGDASSPYVEWDLCAPQSIYGYSKHLGECYVRDVSNRYFIVRTSWLYGSVGGNFVRTIMRLGRDKGFVKVVSDQIGNPTNANDLAYHLLRLVKTDEYGIYHCTGNGECSWYDFANEIIALSGIKATVEPCTTEEFPTPAKRPAYSSLDNAMLRCTIGDEMRDWRAALATGIKKIIQNGID